jgi:uncharacterized protein (DUF4415 family)
MKDKDIKRSSEHPEADVKHIVRGIARQGLKPTSAKTSISLRVDAEVLEWFKAQGPGVSDTHKRGTKGIQGCFRLTVERTGR